MTTLAPTGVERRYEAISPAQKHAALSAPAQRTTARKLLNTRMAVHQRENDNGRLVGYVAGYPFSPQTAFAMQAKSRSSSALTM